MNFLRTTIRKVELRELLPHPVAQRNLDQSWLRLLKANFTPSAIGVIHCVEYKIGDRDGFWIVDGQHRWTAAMSHDLGGTRVYIFVHCEVKNDASSCDLFLWLNNKKLVSAYAKYMAELNGHHPHVVAINEVVESFGLKVSDQCHDGNLTAVSALRSTAAKGLDVLRGTLEILVGSWGTRAATVDGKLLQGYGMLSAANNGTIEKSVMIHKLSKYKGGPTALIGDARGLKELTGQTVPRCVAEIVRNTYNKGKRSGQLPPL